MNNENSKELPDFGDYVTIEMHRFGADNEFYTHKVINRLKSNAWVPVPVVANAKEVLHDGDFEDVISCICGGVYEREVFKYRICDVKLTRKPNPIKFTAKSHAIGTAVFVTNNPNKLDGIGNIGIWVGCDNGKLKADRVYNVTIEEVPNE